MPVRCVARERTLTDGRGALATSPDVTECPCVFPLLQPYEQQWEQTSGLQLEQPSGQCAGNRLGASQLENA